VWYGFDAMRLSIPQYGAGKGAIATLRKTFVRGSRQGEFVRLPAWGK
jgi:hypothetical protein